MYVIKPVLDRKGDRYAEKLQHTTTDVGEQDTALEATGRTAKDNRGQSIPGPPLRTLQTTTHRLARTSE